jgi:hypothetical protein
MNYHQREIIKHSLSILESVRDSVEYDDKCDNLHDTESMQLNAAISALKFLPKRNTEYSEDILIRAKQLKDDWLSCKDDLEKILLAKKSGEIVFLLDTDYTICNLASDNKEANKIFGDHLLQCCIGNTDGVTILLNIFKIPWEVM